MQTRGDKLAEDLVLSIKILAFKLTYMIGVRRSSLSLILGDEWGVVGGNFKDIGSFTVHWARPILESPVPYKYLLLVVVWLCSFPLSPCKSHMEWAPNLFLRYLSLRKLNHREWVRIQEEFQHFQFS